MASLGRFTTSTTTPHASQSLRCRAVSRRPRRSYFLCQSCQPTNKPQPPAGGGDEKKSAAGRLLGSVVKAGMAARESLSPKQKGDWKDVTLMSFSFAVYVYISQKLVCTYCAWMSMINHH